MSASPYPQPETIDAPNQSKNGQEGGRIPDPLTQVDIDEFKTLMRGECGVELSNQEAWDRATDLVGLYRMLAGPIPEDPERNGPCFAVQTSSDLP